MIRIISIHSTKREEIRNGSGVCYKGKLLGANFSFNIYHHNQIFNKDQVDTDFDDKMPEVIKKNADVIKAHCLNREFNYLSRKLKVNPRK